MNEVTKDLFCFGKNNKCIFAILKYSKYLEKWRNN